MKHRKHHGSHLLVCGAVAALALAAVACASGDDGTSREATTGAVASAAPPTAAEALLARSIEFHDPQGRWGRDLVQLTWNGTDAQGEERSVFDISIFPDGSTFEMDGRYRGSAIEYATAGTEMTVRVDGTAPDNETRESLRLNRDGGMFWRDYFGFLAGLPMKLRDPGTIIDPEPSSTEFSGRPVASIRVTYEPEVGGDTWYFYFDPQSAELVGCRFYHDEAANDGEYIVFRDLIEADGLRIPQKRRWYMNADDLFLGEDVIERLSLGGGR